MQNSEAGVYDGWYTGRLFSGVSKASDAAGVVVPLTPTIERDCLLLACWHTTQAEKIDRNTLSMVTAIMAPWSAFNSIHEVCLLGFSAANGGEYIQGCAESYAHLCCLQRVMLRLLPYSRMSPLFPKALAQRLVSPSMLVDLERKHRTDHADLALLRPSNWPMMDASPPHDLQGFTNFFVPACDDLQAGHPIVIIGHGGKVCILMQIVALICILS